MNAKDKLKMPVVGLPDPPITREVSLPAVVSVRYLAEVCGESVEATGSQLNMSVDRSVSFHVAAKLLRKYGIESKFAAA